MNAKGIFVSFALAFVLPVCAFGYTVNLHYGWKTEDVRISEKDGFDYLGVRGAIFSDGSLGQVYDLKLIPEGYKVSQFRIARQEWQDLAGSFRIGKLNGKAMALMMGDEEGGLGYLGSTNAFGFAILTAAVRPFRFVDGKLSVLKAMDVEIECEPDPEVPRPLRRSHLTDSYLRRVMGKLLGTDITSYGSWLTQGYRDWVSEAPSPDGSVVDCVIVTSDSLASVFQELAAWHDKLGVRTVVRSVEWIESNYSGADGAEKVRNFLRDAYENWGTIYALLGGAPEIVPMRYIWTNYYGGEFIPTDVYYGDLAGTWNADGDNIYGEFGNSPDDPGDDVAFYAQLFTGRAPVRNSVEAQAFVDKTMAYADEADSSFATSALFLGEVIFPQDWQPGDPITLDGGDICDSASTYFPAYFDTLKLYQKWGNMTRTSCMDAFDVGYNYNIIAGHGDAFRMSAAEGDPPYIYAEDFDTLSNYNRWGFVYALNCNNLAVDVDCVFRHFLLNPNGGASAVYATTRYDFPNVGQYFLDEFLDLVFNAGITRLGDACTLHHIKFIPTALVHEGAVRWSVFTYLLAGDPVVRLWVDEPGEFEVVHGGSLSVGDSLVVVEVRDGGVGVEGAVVVLEGGYGEYGVGVSGVGGIAEVGFRPLGVGVVRMYVSGDGYRVYEDSLEVVGGGRCYVSSVEVDDGDGWVGNGDGVAGWGERVGLGVGLRNGGVGDIGGVWGKLREVEGCSLWVYVEIDSGVVDSLVNIGSGSRHPDGNPFGLGVERWVMGRGLGGVGEEVGCWIWLDGMGWHVRFVGDGGEHAYRCSLGVYGGMVGVSGYGLEVGDSLVVDVGVSISGGLGVGDYEDGIDMEVGLGGMVEVLVDSVYYGVVGGSEEVGWYEVGFDSVGGMDGVGVWFELEMGDSIGSRWSDWVWVEVEDGELVLERLRYDGGGDSLGLYCGVRNVGGGGLVGVEGRLRGLWGVEVLDSVSWYGDIGGGSYSEGDGYGVREYGDSVRYELELVDGYGRRWLDTLGVRDVGVVSGLVGEVGSDYVDLSWGCSDSLVDGYDIYRSDDYSGGYSLVGMVDGYRRYKDVGLVSEEDYYYYVEGRDGDGNLSEPSETLCVWTGSPQLPGFPIATTNVFPSSPVVADIDKDGYKEIIIGSKDKCVHVWHYDGTPVAGWPGCTGDEVWSTAAVANLDDDPELEIIISSYDGDVYGWNADGSGIRNPDGVFRHVGGLCKSPPAIDDLDGDLQLEIVATNSYGQVYVWHEDGTGYLQPNGFFAQGSGNMAGSPTLADIDGDDDLEIIVGSTGGDVYVWHHDGTGYLQPDGIFASYGGVYGALAVGDVDNNGDMELVMVGLYWKAVAVFDHDGTFHGGWPRNVDCGAYASPALADLDGDGRLDIIVGTHRGSTDTTASMYVFSDNGEIRPGWPISLRADFYSSPAVGDIDGDGDPDIVVGSTDGRIYAWHKDGTPVDGWPRNFMYAFYSSPTLTDIDNDGDVDIVIAGYDGKVYVFDLSAPYNESTMEWPKICHDLFNSGLYHGPSKAGVNGSARSPQKFILQTYPLPARGCVTIKLGIPSQASSHVDVDVYDVRGRLVRQVYKGALDPGYHNITWDGKDEAGSEAASGIYFIKANHMGKTRNRKIVLVR